MLGRGQQQLRRMLYCHVEKGGTLCCMWESGECCYMLLVNSSANAAFSKHVWGMPAVIAISWWWLCQGSNCCHLSTRACVDVPLHRVPTPTK